MILLSFSAKLPGKVNLKNLMHKGTTHRNIMLSFFNVIPRHLIGKKKIYRISDAIKAFFSYLGIKASYISCQPP